MSRDIVRDFHATIKNTVGGELTTYTKLVNDALDLAFARLRERAISLGADGVFGVQVVSSHVTAGAAEIIVIGTAYKTASG